MPLPTATPVPSRKPSLLPTSLPTKAADTVTVGVTLSVAASSADSLSNAVALEALKGKLGGANTSAIRNLVVHFASGRRLFSSSVTYATRSLGTATVAFEIVASLASVGYSDAANFQSAVENDLKTAVSDGSFTADLQASYGCSDVSALAVSVTSMREYSTHRPSPLPSTAPSQRLSPEPSLTPNPSLLLKSFVPSASPSARPSHLPSSLPTREPSPVPSLTPSHIPLPAPSASPSSVPTLPPTRSPSALPTINLALSDAFSANDVEAASTNPLVAGGIFVLCVAIALLIGLLVHKKYAAPHFYGHDEHKGSNANDSASVAGEAALLAQLQAGTDDGSNDADVVEISLDDDFVDEEAARPTKEKKSKLSTASDFETVAQKRAEEFERFKLSTAAKLKKRQKKISKLETAAKEEAAKAADLEVKLEEAKEEAATAADLAMKFEEAKQEAEMKASDLLEVAHDKEALENRVAELTEKLSRLQEKDQAPTDAASEDNNCQQLPTPLPPPRNNEKTTAIPTELLKGLLGDATCSAPESQEGGEGIDDDPRTRVMKAGNSVGGAGNVRVAVRVRPPNQRELAGEGNGVCVEVVPTDNIVKVGSDRAFTFDVAFSMEATQAQVFDKLWRGSGGLGVGRLQRERVCVRSNFQRQDPLHDGCEGLGSASRLDSSDHIPSLGMRSGVPQ